MTFFRKLRQWIFRSFRFGGRLRDVRLAQERGEVGAHRYGLITHPKIVGDVILVVHNGILMELPLICLAVC